MDWNEQVSKARANGLEYATNGIAGGEKSPAEAPLSGEWAGAITPRDVVEMSTSPLPDGEVWEDGRTAGPSTFDGAADWEVEELCDAWEDGYRSAPWPRDPETFAVGDEVEILMGGEWVGPYTVTDGEGRSPEHLVLRGRSGVFEHHNDAPHNIRQASDGR